MRVLQIAPRVCWPLDTGAKLRNYHLARVLSERAAISLLAFGDEAGTPAELSFYDDVIVVPRRRGYTPEKILRGALGTTPLPVLNYTSETMKRTIDRLMDSRDFDLVQIESIHLMAYLPSLRAARSAPKIICDWHNIESELMSRYAERESRYLRRNYARFTARMMDDFEKRALRDFDAHITVSERDANRLRQINPDANIFVIENGVDPSHYSSTAESATRNRIIFVGSMDYHANIDAVVEFAREVWPGVKERKPELNFTIVGRDPAPEVRELSKHSGIEVTGTVDDVRPFYDQACAAIVPLRVGGGSRLKILEAMAAGVPVVSTALGAEGLAVQDDKNILIADTNERMQQLLIGLVDDRERQNRIAAGGRALVTDRYDWARLETSLFEIYQGLQNS